MAAHDYGSIGFVTMLEVDGRTWCLRPLAWHQSNVQNQGRYIAILDALNQPEQGGGERLRLYRAVLQEFVITAPFPLAPDRGDGAGDPAIFREKAAAKQFDECGASVQGCNPIGSQQLHSQVE